MPAASLFMGIAWYGREYPTVGPYYQAATNVSLPDQRAYAYSLPMQSERARTLGQGELWDASTQTPWYRYRDATKPWLWWEGYFDNARSLRLKYEVAKAQRLKGIMIWMLNGCTRTQAPELWQGIYEAFGPAQGPRRD